jgi:hypothetical protein
MAQPCILIASAVHKDAKIVNQFLKSLSRLDTDGLKVSYCFVDDNESPDSSQLLADFIKNMPDCELLQVPNVHKNLDWEKDDHSWSMQKIEKIAHIKNKVIEHFLSGKFSHLFLIDADLVLHPKTLHTLLDSQKDIISNIFWTQWNENSIPLPQVWLKDFYTLYDAHMLVPKSDEQISLETEQFLGMLWIPGIYKVGGLGACTLIRRKPLEAGVNFNSIYNLSFWGEDRSFCIRAAALGFELYVNTVHPAFHIFRIQELDHLQEWLDRQSIQFSLEDLPGKEPSS